MSPLATVIFEGEVNVMMSAFNGRLAVRTQVAMLLGKGDTVEQHVYFGLHDVLVAMPHCTNAVHQLSKLGDLGRAQRGRGKQEGNDPAEDVQVDAEFRSHLLVDHTFHKSRELR